MEIVELIKINNELMEENARLRGELMQCERYNQGLISCNEMLRDMLREERDK